MNNKIKILLVDDTPENIDTLGVLLKDYKRQVALNGVKALQLAQKDPQPDLILLDIVMPGLNGYEVCKLLKTNEKTKNIPIIFLTSKTDRKSILEGFEVGAQDYITKPFDARELLARVKTQIEIIENRKKLEKLNDWLEDQVNQRTKELQESNLQLKKAKRELENLDASKTEFLKIISHEIRTPLNGIMGGLSILKEFELPNETLVFIDILDKSVDRLENFSYSALDISLLKVKGAEAMNKKPTDLSEIFLKTENSLTDKIKSQKLEIIKEIKGESYLLNIDAEYFEKALKNLLDNAIKFSPIGGSIKITYNFNSEGVSIKIQDEGKGFSKKMLQSLSFLDSGEHIDENPGLGLYLASLIIKSHQGELTYKNNKQGAEVTITIPHE